MWLILRVIVLRRTHLFSFCVPVQNVKELKQGCLVKLTIRFAAVSVVFVIAFFNQTTAMGDDNSSEVSFTETTRGIVKRSKSGVERSQSPSSGADPAATAPADKSRIAPEVIAPEVTAQEPVVQEPVKKLSNRPPDQPKLTLKRVLFEGNTALKDGELEALSEPYLNRPLRFSDLEQLRVDVTRAYTSKGYINSGAVLPDQKVDDGQLTYRIVEGRLDKIEVTGTGRLKPGYVANRVRFGAGEPFNSENLQESFQLLLDDPLIERMDGQLLPLPQAGQTSLKLRVTPSAPWLLNLTADNHGSPSVGAEQLTFAGTYLNPTGYGDSADLAVNFSPGRYNLSAAYSVPVTVRDTRVSIDLGTTNSTVVEAPLDDIDIESDSTSLGLSLSHPLRRNLQGSTRVGVDLTVRDNSNTLLGDPFSFSAGEEDGESRVSALRVWQDFTRRNTDQVIALRSSINLGIDAFGSTVHSDDRPDSEFVAWLGQAQFVRSYQEGIGQLLLRADAQIANEELLPLERFALGGAGSVRGYRKNQLVRDQAFFLSAEYRYTFNNSETGIWQLAPFLDFGSGRNRGSEDDDSDTLFSIGAGLLWSKSRYNAELYIGQALEDVAGSTDNDLQDDGVHFRFSTRLF